MIELFSNEIHQQYLITIMYCCLLSFAGLLKICKTELVHLNPFRLLCQCSYKLSNNTKSHRILGFKFLVGFKKAFPLGIQVLLQQQQRLMVNPKRERFAKLLPLRLWKMSLKCMFILRQWLFCKHCIFI